MCETTCTVGGVAAAINCLSRHAEAEVENNLTNLQEDFSFQTALLLTAAQRAPSHHPGLSG